LKLVFPGHPRLGRSGSTILLHKIMLHVFLGHLQSSLIDPESNLGRRPGGCESEAGA
jgi:hypothetical protein